MTKYSPETLGEEGTDEETVSTYNIAAAAYAKKYEAIGARRVDVERGFSYVNTPTPLVVELGSGNGREASVILEKTNRYIGVDVSRSMIEIARQNLPGIEFIESDAFNYHFPDGIDIVFAFVSLLHLDRAKMQTLFAKIGCALREKGIFYVSLKQDNVYSDEISADEFGNRHFYYYPRATLLEILPEDMHEVYVSEHSHGGRGWITVVFRKH
jgi:SAM-dependent methyltransferase